MSIERQRAILEQVEETRKQDSRVRITSGDSSSVAKLEKTKTVKQKIEKAQ